MIPWKIPRNHFTEKESKFVNDSAKKDRGLELSRRDGWITCAAFLFTFILIIGVFGFSVMFKAYLVSFIVYCVAFSWFTRNKFLFAGTIGFVLVSMWALS